MRRLVFFLFAIFISFSSMILFSSSVFSEENIGFTDVNSEEVTRLFEEKIITGYSDLTFRPQQPVTRGEAATMIGRSLQLNSAMRPTHFPDVAETHFASGFIQSAVEYGIITGYSDGTYRPERSITRAEMAIMLARAFPYEQVTTIQFTDVDTATSGQDSIIKLASSGIINGYPDGTYRPQQAITRLEFSLLVARTLYPDFRPYVPTEEIIEEEIIIADEETVVEVPTEEEVVTEEEDIAVEEIVEDSEKEEIVLEDGVIDYGTVVNAPDGLNVRPSPTKENTPITRLTNGTKVKVHEVINNWALISAGDIEGYVSLDYLLLDSVITTVLGGKTIVIDPGHGGSDPGAIGNGIQEKDLILDVSLMVRDKLEAAGVNVVMTRSTDVYVSLENRIKIANEAEASSFISIHANAATAAAHGTETFWNRTYSSTDSQRLAQSVQTHLIQNLKTRDRGVKEANFQVILKTTMPSVLVELGFITNTTEAAKLKEQETKVAAADAIFLGLLEFYR